MYRARGNTHLLKEQQCHSSAGGNIRCLGKEADTLNSGTTSKTLIFLKCIYLQFLNETRHGHRQKECRTSPVSSRTGEARQTVLVRNPFLATDTLSIL